MRMPTRPGLPRGRFFWEALWRSGLSAAIGRRYGGVGSVFMFHRVLPAGAAKFRDDLAVTDRFLRAFLSFLRRRRIEILSLDDAVETLRGAKPRPEGQPFVALTFDDGYADTLLRAAPLLEEFGAPFTVHVTTEMVENGDSLWWPALERLLRRRDLLDLPAMERRFRIPSARAKAAALRRVSKWVTGDPAGRAPLLRPVFRKYGVSPAETAAEEGLSRAQLRELAANPLATIGGHTGSHPDLTQLAEPEAAREIAANKDYLERVCERPVEHFALPYGRGGPREFAMAAEAGFRTALTTRSGALFPEHAAGRADLPLRLPRHTADGSRMWLSFMEAQRRGARRFLESPFGPPAVGTERDSG